MNNTKLKKVKKLLRKAGNILLDITLFILIIILTPIFLLMEKCLGERDEI